MDWSVVITAVSALIALGAVVESRRSRKLAERAAASADEAAERSAAAAERAADALEWSTALAEVEAAERERVTWSLTHHKGDTYRLTNTSRRTAHNVVIDCEGAIRGGASRVDQLAPEEAVTFAAAQSMGRRAGPVTVSWLNEPDDVAEQQERQKWRHPLPPKR